MEHDVIIVELDTPCRLDAFLAATINHTRSHIKKLIEEGCVLVDNLPILKAGFLVKKNNKIIINYPEIIDLNIAAEDIAIKIVYEDKYLAVIDKPQNLSVHPSNNIVSGTLVNALLFHLKDLSGINGVQRPGIVHRLDKNTSGLMLVAKTDSAHIGLAEQIASKSATRIYTALCEGVIKEDKGIITTQIGRDPKDRKKMAVLKSGGRTAITEYTVIKRFKVHTLVSFKLQTGRTHQIRVHAKHIKHPVVGDEAYGFSRQRFQLKGQLLHSSKLIFVHPITNETMEFSSELPDYFLRVLDIIK